MAVCARARMCVSLCVVVVVGECGGGGDDELLHPPPPPSSQRWQALGTQQGSGPARRRARQRLVPFPPQDCPPPRRDAPLQATHTSAGRKPCRRKQHQDAMPGARYLGLRWHRQRSQVLLRRDFHQELTRGRAGAAGELVEELAPRVRGLVVKALRVPALAKQSGNISRGVFFLIPSGPPHVRCTPMWALSTREEPGETGLTPHGGGIERLGARTAP